MNKSDRAKLAEATTARRALLRQGIVDARDSVTEAEGTLQAVLEAGEPTNGLAEAIREVLTQLGRSSEALRRTEEAQFAGDLPQPEGGP